MSWIWPNKLNEQATIVVRVGRAAHWAALGVAAFGLIIGFYAMIQGNVVELLPYIAVGLFWVSVAMIGRGVRYVLASE